MAVYFVANIKLTDKGEYDKYLEECDVIFKKYKGKYLAVDEHPVVLEGNYSHSKTVIIEFENQVLFDEWYYSKEYQRILKYRLKGSECNTLLVRGKEELLGFSRTNTKDKRFLEIIDLLNNELLENYREEQKTYDHLNILPEDTLVILVEWCNKEIGSGCLKKNGENQYEVKRVYIKKEMRGKGISKKLMHELEIWAKEKNARELVLETGIKQTAAIDLYKSIGFKIIENYGEYAGNENSICMKKEI